MLVVGLVVGGSVAVTASPALAADQPAEDARVSVTGPVRVEADERVDGAVVSVDGSVRVAGVVDGDVFVVRGGVVVTGRVTGSVTVLDGNVRVIGTVGDHVTVVSGRAFVGDEATVGGDVRSSKRPRVAAGADVDGDVEKANFAVWFTVAGWIALLLWWLVVSITLFVVGLLCVLLFPRAVGAVTSTGRRSTGPCAAWGALLGLVLPVLAGVLASSVVGLPLAFGVLLTLAVAFPLGYLATAVLLGRVLLRGAHDVVAFLVGFAILRALALIPGLGWLIGFVAAAYGLGVLGVTAWRAGRPPAATASGRDDEDLAAEVLPG